jgi:hypothetical protein
MMSIKSRRKGAKEELAIVKLLQAKGFAAEKVSAMYRAGPDLSVPLLGVDRDVEVKVRATGFSQLYAWLTDRDILIVRADRREPLVIVPLKLAVEIAAKAEQARITKTAWRIPGT